jgi:hypothetical protein
MIRFVTYLVKRVVRHSVIKRFVSTAIVVLTAFIMLRSVTLGRYARNRSHRAGDVNGQGEPTMPTERQPEVSAVGRALSALRRRYRKVCALPGCGKEFEGTVRRQYCCNAHAAKAVKLRRKTQRQEPTSEAAQ